jgi:RNA polymerase sigma-70 factor, ECF subfamily
MLRQPDASVWVKDGKFPKREAELTEDAGAIATDADAARGAAFERFADERLDASYRLARLILRDAQEAEDATHDAFARAWRDLHRLRDADRMDAWFGRILTNACKDRLRRGRIRRHERLDPATGHADAHDANRQVEDRDSLDRAFGDLNADQRIAVVLRFYGDLSVDQVARSVGAPVGTVRSRLHYALRQLRAALERADR